MARSPFRKAVTPEVYALPAYIERIKTGKTVEQLTAEINAAGWRVNNLFQIYNGIWRCNLRFDAEERGGMRTYFHEFAEAQTMEEAMAAAIWNMQQRRNDKTRGTYPKPRGSRQLAMRENQMSRQRLLAELERWTLELLS